jgi:tetratricopeptide (TPR) repeat protein
MRRILVTSLVVVLLVPWSAILAQQGGLQVAPPSQRIEPPSPSATPDQLERRADELRAEKAYLDAIDYYHAAIAKSKTPVLYNKLGIAELQLQRLNDARKDFVRAIKMDKQYAEAMNNLGVVDYSRRKYNSAIKEYKKAIAIEESASFHSNLGSAYFAKKQYELAAAEYNRAVQIDPDIFERVSSAGVSARLQSPEDRAHFFFVLARMYANIGNFDRSLDYLERAMEDGYKVKDEVYKDEEFAKLRLDPRFAELMARKLVEISQ